jgi:hypothetical protein
LKKIHGVDVVVGDIYSLTPAPSSVVLSPNHLTLSSLPTA